MSMIKIPSSSFLYAMHTDTLLLSHRSNQKEEPFGFLIIFPKKQSP